MEHLYGKTLAELRVIAEQFGLPRFAAGQIARWLYKRHVNDIAAMTDLSAAARARLSERFDVHAQISLCHGEFWSTHRVGIYS